MINLFKSLEIYYFVINLIAFLIMGLDKRKAIVGKWRIKENTLFLTAILGGFVGYYGGMYFFHHKTRKPLFHVVFYGSLVLHFCIIYLVSKYIL